MDHACHQCGQEIEEGNPFCRHCGAPQIRIPGLEEEAATPPMPAATAGEVQPPAEPVVVGRPAPSAPAAVDWSQALPAALLAGALLALTWLPYIGYLLVIAAAGMAGVAFYQRRVPTAVVTPAIGARIGAVTGLFGFAGFAALAAIVLLLLRGKFREILQQALQQAAARNPDPAMQDAMRQMTSPAGLAFIMTLIMVIALIGFIALSAAGGAIGTWLYRRKSE